MGAPGSTRKEPTAPGGDQTLPTVEGTSATGPFNAAIWKVISWSNNTSTASVRFSDVSALKEIIFVKRGSLKGFG